MPDLPAVGKVTPSGAGNGNPSYRLPSRLIKVAQMIGDARREEEAQPTRADMKKQLTDFAAAMETGSRFLEDMTTLRFLKACGPIPDIGGEAARQRDLASLARQAEARIPRGAGPGRARADPLEPSAKDLCAITIVALYDCAGQTTPAPSNRTAIDYAEAFWHGIGGNSSFAAGHWGSTRAGWRKNFQRAVSSAYQSDRERIGSFLRLPAPRRRELPPFDTAVAKRRYRFSWGKMSSHRRPKVQILHSEVHWGLLDGIRVRRVEAHLACPTN